MSRTISLADSVSVSMFGSFGRLRVACPILGRSIACVPPRPSLGLELFERACESAAADRPLEVFRDPLAQAAVGGDQPEPPSLGGERRHPLRDPIVGDPA